MLSRSLLNSLNTMTRTTQMQQQSVVVRHFSSPGEGGRIPSGTMALVVKHDGENGFSREMIDIAEYVDGKKVIIVGYPGAFTTQCMTRHLPDFISKADEIKRAGCDEILALSVNDPFVVTAFAEKLGGEHLVNYVADGNGEITKALGLE